MSANDKFRLGYGDYRYGSILSYENKVLQSVFMNKECDIEDTHVNDRYTEGRHATSADESDSKPVEYAFSESDSSVGTTTSMAAPVDNAPKIICEPKVWTDAPIIKEYESDSDDDSVSNDRHNHTKKGLGYAFTRKACFVCGSFSHLIRDRDFYEKRMAKQAALTKSKDKDDPHKALKDKRIIDSGCYRHMTGNKSHLADYQDFKGGFFAFRGSNGRITGKGKKKAGRLDFTDVYYVEELKHYNLFSVSQMCDNKNKVLFTDTDCLVMSPNFKLPDENQALLKISRQYSMYSFNLKNIDPSGDLSYLFAKASIDESNKWCRRLGIKMEYSNTITPQQNRVDERKNINLIEAARIMLADLFLPTTFWAEEKEANDAVRKETTHENQNANTNNTNLLNVVSTPISTVGPSIALNDDEHSYPDDPLMPHLEDIYASPSEGIFTNSSYDNEGVVTDFNNLETTVNVSPTPTTIIHTIHPKTQILGDPMSAVQTRSKVNKNSEAYALFQIQKVWILVDLPFGKKAIGTKWVYMNKKDKRGVVVRNKARLVAQDIGKKKG
nr:ribonuclease H-like domain-containing protein [Tanacetum cinerariifolium]